MDTTGESSSKSKKFFDPKIHSPSFLGSWLVLMVFWVLITWTLNYQSLLAGFIGSYALTRFNYSLLITSEQRFQITGKTAFMFIRYLGLMLVAIVKANIDVAKIVLQRKMPISPGIVKFKSDIKKDLDRVILANSITLTPGTLTIDMVDDVYVVHCLTRENADEVCSWNMGEELLQIERTGSQDPQEGDKGHAAG